MLRSRIGVRVMIVERAACVVVIEMAAGTAIGVTMTRGVIARTALGQVEDETARRLHVQCREDQEQT